MWDRISTLVVLWAVRGLSLCWPHMRTLNILRLREGAYYLVSP